MSQSIGSLDPELDLTAHEVMGEKKRGVYQKRHYSPL